MVNQESNQKLKWNRSYLKPSFKKKDVDHAIVNWKNLNKNVTFIESVIAENAKLDNRDVTIVCENDGVVQISKSDVAKASAHMASVPREQSMSFYISDEYEIAMKEIYLLFSTAIYL